MINLDEQLKDVRTVAIAGHVRPDGDAFGSCMVPMSTWRAISQTRSASLRIQMRSSPVIRRSNRLICSYRSMSRLLTGLEALCRISMRQSARL